MLAGIIIVLVISILLSIKLSFKVSGGNEKSILLSGFIIVLFTCLNLLIFVFSLAIFQEYRKIFSYRNSYEATVVGEKGIAAKNTFRNSYSEYAIYAPIVEFKNSEGHIVRIETNKYSSEKPIVGSKKRVVYSGNSVDTYARDVSFGSIILLFLGLIFIELLIIISYFLASYTFGINQQRRKKWAKIIFSVFIFLDVCLTLCSISIIN